MVAALVPKPYSVPDFPTMPRTPPARPPLRLVPPPETPPLMPGSGFGRMFGGIGFSISMLWTGKAAYDAVKAVPSQIPWLPGPSVASEIWTDPQRVMEEAHARFSHIDTPHLNQLLFIREKQAIPMRRDATHDPSDRHLMVQDDGGNWVEVPLNGQETGALVIGDLWKNGFPRKPTHERASDEIQLIEFELGRRSFQSEPKTDADKSFFEQYAEYIRELAEAMRKRANGENVPLPVLVINTPEETKMGQGEKIQSRCSAQGSETAKSLNVSPDAATDKVPESDLERVQRLGVLRIGTSGDYFPFSFINEKGVLSGIDVEIGKLLSSALGVRAEFILFRWQEWAKDIVDGQYDVAMSGITVTDERLQKMVFSSAYLQSGAVPMALQVADIQDVASINVPSIRLVVNRGGYLESVARRFFPRAQIITITENTRLGEFVASGKADALLTDSLESKSFEMHYPELGVINRITSDQHAYALPRDNVGIRERLNYLLAEIKENGFLAKLLEEYGIQI